MRLWLCLLLQDIHYAARDSGERVLSAVAFKKAQQLNEDDVYQGAFRTWNFQCFFHIVKCVQGCNYILPMQHSQTSQVT